MATLNIRIEFADPSDLDWLKTRILSAVQDTVETADEEGRLDGLVNVESEVDFGD